MVLQLAPGLEAQQVDPGLPPLLQLGHLLRREEHLRGGCGRAGGRVGEEWEEARRSPGRGSRGWEGAKGRALMGWAWVLEAPIPRNFTRLSSAALAVTSMPVSVLVRIVCACRGPERDE